jgi:hypothetical protein
MCQIIAEIPSDANKFVSFMSGEGLPKSPTGLSTHDFYGQREILFETGLSVKFGGEDFDFVSQILQVRSYLA